MRETNDESWAPAWHRRAAAREFERPDSDARFQCGAARNISAGNRNLLSARIHTIERDVRAYCDGMYCSRALAATIWAFTSFTKVWGCGESISARVWICKGRRMQRAKIYKCYVKWTCRLWNAILSKCYDAVRVRSEQMNNAKRMGIIIVLDSWL